MQELISLKGREQCACERVWFLPPVCIVVTRGGGERASEQIKPERELRWERMSYLFEVFECSLLCVYFEWGWKRYTNISIVFVYWFYFDWQL